MSTRNSHEFPPKQPRVSSKTAASVCTNSCVRACCLWTADGQDPIPCPAARLTLIRSSVVKTRAVRARPGIQASPDAVLTLPARLPAGRGARGVESRSVRVTADSDRCAPAAFPWPEAGAYGQVRLSNDFETTDGSGVTFRKDQVICISRHEREDVS